MDGVLYCKTHFEQLFKETGTFSKKFQGGASSNKSYQAKAPSSYRLHSLELKTNAQGAKTSLSTREMLFCDCQTMISGGQDL
ncbi:hypothetical protein HU200_039333 [Digitaria exilis]|uniref:Uncharacterized protein n=1 Tax=Digitaria exilis TaxID=1010633 RepID=A0A835BBH1_9POAL|nr:hypothetical protein HU200_039333 [Digitaria exilis]